MLEFFIIWIPFLVFITLFLVNALSLKPAKDFSWPINVNRRDMEHLDACMPGFGVIFTFSNEIEGVSSLLQCGRSFSHFQNTFIRRRGGVGTEPNTDSKFIEVPSVTKMNFMWNGLICLAFYEKVLNLLNSGLGSKNIECDTLLAAVCRTDQGGVFVNPPLAAASPDMIQDSEQRIQKSFASVLSYIDSKSMLLHYFCHHFRDHWPTQPASVLQAPYFASERRRFDPCLPVDRRMLNNDVWQQQHIHSNLPASGHSTLSFTASSFANERMVSPTFVHA